MAFEAKSWMKKDNRVETPDGTGIITNMHVTDKGDKILVYFVDVKLDSRPNDNAECYKPKDLKPFIIY